MDTTKLNQSLPPDFWLKTGYFLGAVVFIVILVRIYQRSNKLWLGIFITAGFGVLFFNWIYNRNEPKFLTPVINKIAVFFPTKDAERPEAGNLEKRK